MSYAIIFSCKASRALLKALRSVVSTNFTWQKCTFQKCSMTLKKEKWATSKFAGLHQKKLQTQTQHKLVKIASRASIPLLVQSCGLIKHKNLRNMLYLQNWWISGNIQDAWRHNLKCLATYLILIIITGLRKIRRCCWKWECHTDRICYSWNSEQGWTLLSRSRFLSLSCVNSRCIPP